MVKQKHEVDGKSNEVVKDEKYIISLIEEIKDIVFRTEQIVKAIKNG